MKNIGLLTKESINQFKNKWMLFLFYLLFLIISIAIIVGLIHFTYSFGHDAKKFDSLDRVDSLRIRAPRVKDISDAKDGEGTYWKFVESEVEKYSVNSEDKTTDPVSYILANRGNVPVSDNEDSLFAHTADCMHNLFVKWILQNQDIKDYFSANNSKLLEVVAQQLNLGVLDNNKMMISMVDAHGPKVKATKTDTKDNVKNSTNAIYEWQIRDDEGQWIYRIGNSIKDFSLTNFDPDKNANDVIVTPAFLKFNHYKLGETRTLLYGGQAYKIRFAATAITPGQTVSDKTNVITVNPVLYNKIYAANYQPGSPLIKAVDFSVPPRNAEKFNKVCEKEYNDAKEIFSKSFSDSALQSTLQKLSFGSTPVHSYQMQLMLYNLISWIVTAILIILLVAAYRFIQALIINSEKSILINLKSIGVNSHEISYFLSISFLPTLIVGAGVGLGLAELVYYLMTQTLGRAVSFTLAWSPESILGYCIFAAIFVGLIVVGSFMSWLSTRGNKLSIHSKVQLSKTELLLLDIKNLKIFKDGFGKVIYSFQISNLLKAFSTFIVTILSLTVLGISLQFLVSIGSALNNKPYIYHKTGESLSFREYSNNQIKNTNKSLSEYTEIKDKPLVNKNKNDNPYKVLENWALWFKDDKNLKDKPMYDLYFDDLKNVDKFYKDNKEGLANKENQKEFNNDLNKDIIPSYDPEFDYAKKTYDGFTQLDKLVTTYRTEFGEKEALPKIFFRDRPKLNDWISYDEMHMANAVSYNVPIAVFNQNSEDKKSMKSNEIIVNNFTLRKFNLSVGQNIDIKFSGVSALDMITGKTDISRNNVAENDLTLKIIGVNSRLYNQAEAIVNFNAIRQANKHEIMNDYRNGVISSSPIPYDVKNFVIPVGNSNTEGSNFWDYFPDAFNKTLVTDMSFSSLPIIHDFYMKKTAEFRSFATILSVLLVLVCLCIVLVISILIAYENKNNILVLKTLGYTVGRTLSLFSIVYAIFIAVGFIASVFIAGALIDAFTGTLVNRLGLALTHQYTAETIAIPLSIALVFFMAIVGIVIYTYKKIKAQDITFAE